MSKRKRGRRTRELTRRRAQIQPDEVAELPFGYMARSGRVISMKGTLSSAEHAELVDRLILAAPNIQREQEARRARLLELLRATDPIDLVARASFAYLQIDPDTYREWETDR